MGRKKSSNLVVESNDIAKARLHPKPDSVWEARIIAAIAARNQIDDKQFKLHRIPLRELLQSDMPMSSTQWMDLRKTLVQLVQKYYQVKMANGYLLISVFDVIGIDGDDVLAKFNDSLQPYYLSLHNHFTQYQLPEFCALSSTHSQALFRFLNAWKGLKEATIPLEQLHHSLDVSASARKDFKEFRKHVLEVAHREINDKTSLFFAWEPVREGLRKVVAIRFVFSRVPIAPIGTNEKSQGGKQPSAGEDLEEHAKLQKSSNACFEKHRKSGAECVPKRSKKCRFCQECGRMAAKKFLEKKA